jgi:hypothetical protein
MPIAAKTVVIKIEGGQPMAAYGPFDDIITARRFFKRMIDTRQWEDGMNIPLTPPPADVAGRQVTQTATPTATPPLEALDPDKIAKTITEDIKMNNGLLIEGAADGFVALIDGKSKDLRAIRVATMAEYEAINLYEKLAEDVSDKKLKKVLLDIGKEEKVHVGELEEMLDKLDPEHEPSVEEGAKEVRG